MESFLERERAQLPLWLVAGFGAGIALWFALDEPRAWLATILFGLGAAIAGFSFDGGRLERAIGWLGLSVALGSGLVWLRSDWVAAPRLDRPQVVNFTARVDTVETLAARNAVRLTLAPSDPALPPKVRVNLPEEQMLRQIAPGATIRLRARLMPPPPMALPEVMIFRAISGSGVSAPREGRSDRSRFVKGPSLPAFLA